jgi:uncharacterized protein with NRDE domain
MASPSPLAIIVTGNCDNSAPAEPLARWDQPNHVLAGTQSEAWLGVSDHGRFAAVTNLRGYGPPEPDRVSRGALVTDMLSGSRRYGEDNADFSDFNPFNLIAADRERAWFLSNRPRNLGSLLAPGIYGLSNGALDEPWPKTMRLKEMVPTDVRAQSRLEPARRLARRDPPDVGIRSARPSDVLQEPPPPSSSLPSTGPAAARWFRRQEGRGVIIERRYAWRRGGW